MNKFKSLLACVFFVASTMCFVNGCTHPNKTNNTQEDLTLKVQSDEEVYREGENIQVTFEFINNSNQPIKIVADILSLHQPGLSLYLRKSDGTVFPFCRYTIKETGQSLPIPWQTLNQGETAKTMMILADHSSDKSAFNLIHNTIPPKLPPPDTYTIYATYEFDKAKVEDYGVTIDKADESLIWFGKVVSNTIKITIKPKE